MFYKFNKKTLTFYKVSWVKMVSKYFLILMLVFIFVLTDIGLSNEKPAIQLNKAEYVVITKNDKIFSPENLQEEIKRLHLKFPYIVYAQSMLETGSWTSKAYSENNNLFGMTKANNRASYAEDSTNGKYAVYENWEYSLIDYALYYSKHLDNKIVTEDDFFNYLEKSNYAETGAYISALKRIIKENNLKVLFGN